MNNKHGLYIHIPFCISKCKYCDFYKVTSKKWNTTHNFFKSLEKELSQLPKNFQPLSIFIGGGTPSAISDSDYKLLISLLLKYVDKGRLIEWTSEANPSSLTKEKLQIMREAGINRLSIGIQSFNDKSLKLLGRNHDNKIAINAYRQAKKYGFDNINIDLIQSIPNQNIKSIDCELEIVKSIMPDHISYYNLIYEPNTQLNNELENGKIKSIDDDLESDIYYHIVSTLEKFGYEHYEISNFALNNKKSIHNLLYWQGDEYIGCGPSAHSHWENKRFSKVSDIDEYISNIESSKSIIDMNEELDFIKKSKETFTMWLRLTEGVNIVDFEKKISSKLGNIYNSKIDELIDLKLLEKIDGNIRIPKNKIFLSNTIMSELI